MDGPDLQWKNGDAERLRSDDKAPIVACQPKIFRGRAQEFHRGQMQSVKRSHGNWKRLQRASQHRFAQLDQRHAIEKSPSLITMGAGRPRA